MSSDDTEVQHAFVRYELVRCHKEIRDMTQLDPNCDEEYGGSCDRIDPECASLKEINEWTLRKRLKYKVINSKVDLSYEANDMIR